MKQTKVIILIGTEGAGKTYRTKALIKPAKNCLKVFDVNNEYQDLYPFPFNSNMATFLNECKKVKDAVIVIEDATSFFSTRGRDATLVEMMTARRHTGNSFLLLFHSFQDVPKYILRKASDIIIFKTKDHINYMQDEFKNTPYLDAWLEVYEEAKTSKFFSSYPPPKGTTPPSRHIKN